MQLQHIKGAELAQVQDKSKDSPIWSTILRYRGFIEKCGVCATNYQLTVTLPDLKLKSKYVYDRLRQVFSPNSLAEGIWACNSSKMEIEVESLKLVQ